MNCLEHNMGAVVAEGFIEAGNKKYIVYSTLYGY